MREIGKAIFKFMPLKLQVLIKFRVKVGYFPSLTQPKSFNEKIQYRKLYGDNPLYEVCSDKLRVRDYVAEKIGQEYLIPLLYEGDSVTAEQLRAIDEDFVAKTTHDSGSIQLVRQDDIVDYEGLVDTLNDYLARNFGKKFGEPWYSNIEPKVIVEKMLKGPDGDIPYDYKFHVFNNGGTPKVILQIDYGRYGYHNRTFYDEEFNILPYGIKFPNEYRPAENVESIRKMNAVALKLAEGFDYCRIDLYWVDGQIYFGEMTFAPGSGYDCLNETKYDFELGSYWK